MTTTEEIKNIRDKKIQMNLAEEMKSMRDQVEGLMKAHQLEIEGISKKYFKLEKKHKELKTNFKSLVKGFAAALAEDEVDDGN